MRVKVSLKGLGSTFPRDLLVQKELRVVSYFSKWPFIHCDEAKDAHTCMMPPRTVKL